MKNKAMLLIFTFSVLLFLSIVLLSVGNIQQVSIHNSDKNKAEKTSTSTVNLSSLGGESDVIGQRVHKKQTSLPWEYLIYNQQSHAIYYTGTEKIKQVDINGIVPMFTVFQKGYGIFFLDKVSNETVIRISFEAREVTFPFWTIVQDHQTSFQLFINQDGFFIRKDFSYVCTPELQESSEGSCHEESYYLEI